MGQKTKQKHKFLFLIELYDNFLS